MLKYVKYAAIIAAALALCVGTGLSGQMAACIGRYLIYLACCLVCLLLVRAVCPLSSELWRKMLHAVAYTSSLCMMAVSGDWRVASACCALFALVVYPLLELAESWKGYGKLFSQRKTGEVKRSLLLLFFTHAALIAVCWGLLGKPYIAVTGIIMWGTGDTMAALVGKRYGKRHIHLPHADEKKTWEGALAMAVTAFIFGFGALMLTSPFGMGQCMALALACAPVASYVELISHNGHDTATVACAVAAILALIA